MTTTVTVTHQDGTTETLPIEQITPEGPCEWFALCDRPAVALLEHPVLHLVPACERCRTKAEALR